VADEHVHAWSHGDLRVRDFAEEAVVSAAPDRIVFVAGPADVQQSVADPAADFVNQSLPLVHVLSGARRLRRAPGIVLVSSAAVYGQPRELPVKESAPPAPVSPYGFHKLMQETMLAEFRTLYALPVCVVRAFSTLGPGQRRLAVWDIAQKALAGQTELPGTGEETRDYLYADDLGEALARVVSNAAFEGEAINLASGQETPIRELARAIFSLLGASAEPRFTGTPLAGSPQRWRADISRLRSIGFEPKTGIDAALARTIAWIRDHA
jgi:nucleoside-diphosphate-sugar epimerase